MLKCLESIYALCETWTRAHQDMLVKLAYTLLELNTLEMPLEGQTLKDDTVFWDILVSWYFRHFGSDGYSFILASLIFAT